MSLPESRGLPGAGGVSMELTSLDVDECLRDIEIVATEVMPLVK